MTAAQLIEKLKETRSTVWAGTAEITALLLDETIRYVETAERAFTKMSIPPEPKKDDPK